MASYVLALDVGTGAVHSMLSNSEGSVIGTASAPISYSTPPGCPPTAREFDPGAVVQALGRLTKEVLGDGNVRAKDVSCIGITSQRQGIVCLDGQGQELCSSPNIDLRAIFEGAAIDEEMGAEIYATTGHYPSLLMAPARLRWLRIHRPATFDDIRSVLTVAGWLGYRLTGNMVSEPCLEGEAGLLDIGHRQRPGALLSKLGVSASLLPPLAEGAAHAGALAGRMASQWGLPAGIPVVVAGPDTQCGLLGMGLVQEGQTGAVLGWSGAIQVLRSSPSRDEGRRTWVGCYPIEGIWVAECNLGDSGNAYRWLKDATLGRDTSYDEADILAGGCSAASEGIMAFLGPGPGSSFNSGLKMGGLLFPTPLSFQEPTPGQVLRAALENIAFSMRSNLDILREVTGTRAEVLHLGGGMSRSRTLTSVLANVLGLPVKRSATSHISARGAALAAVATVEPSISLKQLAEAAPDNWPEDGELVEPSTRTEIAEYQDHYHHWLQMYERLGPV